MDADTQAVGETTEAEMTQKLVAGIIAFDSKKKEQANDEDKDEEDEELAPTAAEMRTMLKSLERGIEQSENCDKQL